MGIETDTLKAKIGDGTTAWTSLGYYSVGTAGVPVTNDFARFTDEDTIEGRSAAEVRSDINVADGAIANVVEDVAPQLGGDLDLNGFSIAGDGESVENAGENKTTVYLKDGTSNYLIQQTEVWDGDSWETGDCWGFGESVLENNTGKHVTAAGYKSAQDNMGNYVTAAGYKSAQNNSGSYVTASGYKSARDNSGHTVTATGYASAQGNSGHNVTAIGYYSAQNNSGYGATATGMYSAYNNSGSYVTASGFYSALYNSGQYVTVTGYYSALYNSGDDSLGLGKSTLYYNEGDNNIAIGDSAWMDFHADSGSAQTFAHGDVSVEDDTITITGHGFGTGIIHVLYVEGTDPIGGLSNGIYMVKVIDEDTIGFNESDLPDGTEITSTGSGTGHSLTPQHGYANSIVIGSGVEPTASNQVTLGNSSITETLLQGNVRLSADNAKLTVGAGEDASIYYDGTDFVFDSQEVGSGDFKFLNGTIVSGTWEGTAIDGAYIDIEGTEIKSTGEGGGIKYLREDGDGTCSWGDPLTGGGRGSTHAELHENGGDEEINVAGLSGELADDQPPKAHTVASHSDTTATGAELETLTDGSNADSLHTHAGGGGDVDVSGTPSADDFARFTDADTIEGRSAAEVADDIEASIDHGNLTGLSTGADHSYIDQDVTSGSSPTLDGTNITGIPDGALDETYVNADGTVGLSADWDIGDGRRIDADEIRARDGDGLGLYDDGGNGIFVEDGGMVQINGESVTNTDENKTTVYLKDGTSNYLIQQTEVWDGDSWVTGRCWGFGEHVLQNNTGEKITASGYQSAQNNSGNNVTASGYYSAQNNSGYGATASGYFSARNNTGDKVTANGYYSAHSNSGNRVTASGYYSAQNNSGYGATASGYFSARNNTGHYVTASGHNSAYSNSGDDSLGLGLSTLYHNEGDDNIAIGYRAWADFHADSGSAQTFAHGDVSVANDTVTITGHGFGTGIIHVQYAEGTEAIGGLTDGTIYMVKIVDANTIGFNESDLPDGNAITSTGAGTAHELTPQYGYANSIVIGSGAEPTASNQVTLGNSSITETLLQGNVKMSADDAKLTQGAGDDASIYYDGTDFVFDSQEVGSGDFKFLNGNILTSEIRAIDGNGLKLYDDAGNGIFVDDGGYVGIGTDTPSYDLEINGGNLPILVNRSGAEQISVASGWVNLGDSTVKISNSLVKIKDDHEFSLGTSQDYSIGYNSTTDTLQFVDGDTIGSNVRIVLDSTGNVSIPVDNAKLTLGAGDDCEQYYDGTDWIVDTDAVGTGSAKINGLEIDKDGYLKPVTSTESSAPNNSIFYNSDDSVLSYKDSGGSVHNLY